MMCEAAVAELSRPASPIQSYQLGLHSESHMTGSNLWLQSYLNNLFGGSAQNPFHIAAGTDNGSNESLSNSTAIANTDASAVRQIDVETAGEELETYNLTFTPESSLRAINRWPKPDSAVLPTSVGEYTVQHHPDGHYSVKIYKVTDGLDSSDIKNVHEYSEHSSLSAEGTYLITHGISSRNLYSGIAPYEKIVTVSALGGGNMRDWQWSPVDDTLGFYFNVDRNQFIQYDAQNDTHEILWDATDKTVQAANGKMYSNLQIGHADTSDGPMSGQGSISDDGTRIAFKTHDESDAVLIVFDIPTRSIIAAGHIAGASNQKGESRLDISFISPLGDYVGFSRGGNFFSYPVTSMFEHEAQNLGRGHHKDSIVDSHGEQYIITTAYIKYNFATGEITPFFDTSHRRFQAKHIGASNKGDGSFVLSSYCLYSYQHCESDAPEEKENMLLIGNIEEDEKYAWFGWTSDRRYEINYNARAGYYVHQAHANINMHVKYNQQGTIIGPKVVFKSTNGEFRNTIGDIYVAEYFPDNLLRDTK